MMIKYIKVNLYRSLYTNYCKKTKHISQRKEKKKIFIDKTLKEQ